jgi:hypothetical protein
MALDNSKEGAVVKKSGPDPHKSLFSPFLYPADPATWNIKDAASFNNPTILTNPSLLLDDDGKPSARAVFLFYPTGAGPTMKAYGSLNPLSIQINDPSAPLAVAKVRSDNVDFTATNYALETVAIQFVRNFGTNQFEAVRTPSWFFHVDCTTVAATQVVAAVAGKKHRILGGTISVAGGCLAAGLNTISILDVAADMGLDFSVWCGIAATPIPLTFVWDIRPNGKLVAAVNTAINVTLTAAMTAGAISITIWGDDE